MEDNYAYLLRDEKNDETICVDAGDADDISEALPRLGLRHIDFIISTHHHGDHVAGNMTLKRKHGCTIIGSDEGADRIPGIDIRLKDNDTFTFPKSGIQMNAIFSPGHTRDALSYHFPKLDALFSGDTLFAFGC